MRANTVMPFAFTSASNLLIVSFGPWLLGSVVNPSTAIDCTPHRAMTAVRAKSLLLARRPASRFMTIRSLPLK
jgi:hypothetical protein